MSGTHATFSKNSYLRKAKEEISPKDGLCPSVGRILTTTKAECQAAGFPCCAEGSRIACGNPKMPGVECQAAGFPCCAEGSRIACGNPKTPGVEC